MATYYFTGNTNNNWGTATNWSTTSGGTGDGAVPTSTDDVIFDALSPNCTVDTTGRVCLTINFTNYTNTITMTNGITVSGNVTLGASMGISGSSALIVNATATLTSNGKTWSTGLTFSGTITITLADNWTVSGTFVQTSGTTTINNNTIYVGGSMALTGVTSQIRGSVNIVINGTGTLSVATNNVANTIGTSGTFEINTAGTITLGTYFRIECDTVTYTSGTIIYTNALFLVRGYGRVSGTQSVNWTDTITGGGLIIQGAGTLNLVNNINCTGSILIGSSADSLTINSNTIYGSSGLTISTSGIISGTTTIELTGGTWSNSSTGQLRNNLTINGNVTVSGTVYYNTGTLTYTSGTVTTTSSTLNLGAASTTTTLNAAGITWNNVSFLGGTITLNSDVNINGIYSTPTAGVTFNGTWTINVAGGLSPGAGTQQGTGNTTINLTGGTWVGAGGIYINLNLNGTITISGTVYFNFKTLTYVSGTITTTGSTLNIPNQAGGDATLDTSGMTWNNFSTNDNITLLSDLNIGGAYSVLATTTVNGNFNINCSGGITLNSTLVQGTGTTTLNLLSGTWSGNNAIRINMVINGSITVSGSVAYNTGTLTYTSGTVTTTGSTLTIGASTTLDTDRGGGNKITWNNITNTGASTITLLSDLTINGLLSTVNQILTFSGSFNINCNGGITLTGQSIVVGAGSPKIVLTGGTWSASNSTSYLRVDMDINGDVILGTTVNYSTKILTYLGGTVTTTGSTLNINANTTLNTNGITWNNITIPSTSTITLTSNLLANGLYNVGNSANSTVNSTTTETMTIGGGVAIGSNSSLIGTAKLITTGGTISCSGIVAGISKDWDIQGNVTISGSVYFNGKVGGSALTLKYVSGTVTTTSSTLVVAYNGSSSTLDTSGITWNNLTIGVTTNTTTLASNLVVNGLLTISGATTVNGTFNINVSGGITMNNSLAQGTGTTTLNLLGGTWSGSGTLRINTDINGNVTIGGVAYGTGTLTYISGTVTTSGTLSISSSCTLNTNGDSSASATTTSSTGINWNNIALGGSTTITNASNLTAIGGVSTSAGLTGTISGNIFYLHGSISLNGPLAVTNLVFRGASNQTWSGVGGSVSATTIDVNKSGGTLTLGTPSFGVVIGNTTLTNTSSSEIIILAPFVTLGSTNINWPGVIWPSISTDGFVTFTLNHDLLIRGSLGLRYSLTLTGVYNVYVGGSLTTYERGDIGGTATVIMNGTGLLAGRDQFQSDPNSTLHYMRIYCNLKIDTTGTITIGNNLQFNGTGRTYEYVKGNIITNLATDRQFPTHSCSLSIQGSSTFLNFDKIKFKNVSIQTTITANKMFEGTAKIPCNITGTGTINFSDRLEKISKYIKIRNITIGNRGQLLVTYANGNKGGNVGIRFRNDLPNGINQVSNTLVPIETPSYGYGTSMTSDPSMISNI